MKHYHMYTTVLILSLFLIGCSSDDSPVINEPIEISKEIKSLIYFRGDEKAPTVLINAQAGPSTALDQEIIDFFVDDFNTAGILTVNVHQAQTLTPSIVNDNDITLEQAVNFNAESIETLAKVITYFKDQGRTVYVLGLSFGAFVTQGLIAKKGIDIADKYLIISGRLDMNDVMWQGLAEGKEGYFENGVTPILDSEPLANAKNRNLQRLSSGFGKNRYTKLLNTIEDLSSVTYIYGATDIAVGGLTADEVLFLESKNANILAGDGGHDEPFVGFLEQGLNEAFGIQLQ
ncbi:hypothetical protein ATE84_0021 [Aquimarina sp. MAR_2010_214]|uniref:hypothetical protein n=1 Tax=Aquimarina sp. MAR_2010_214 TaxID=1250026 RepID=UPI000C70B6CC|nr:hypothetical protein [Aquimarina sp. MAR_2010_214]PKV48038.1 hypothetical protein ATE84_0021 [Aquimarina sp. MAR_2010_214]